MGFIRSTLIELQCWNKKDNQLRLKNQSSSDILPLSQYIATDEALAYVQNTFESWWVIWAFVSYGLTDPKYTNRQHQLYLKYKYYSR